MEGEEDNNREDEEKFTSSLFIYTTTNTSDFLSLHKNKHILLIKCIFAGSNKMH